jgi:hypothetical protein
MAPAAIHLHNVPNGGGSNNLVGDRLISPRGALSHEPSRDDRQMGRAHQL